MALPEPLRGEVWDVAFPGFGVHPAVVLSVNALNSRLGHVVVLPITGTSGPSLTHIPLGADAGLAGTTGRTSISPASRRWLVADAVGAAGCWHRAR